MNRTTDCGVIDNVTFVCKLALVVHHAKSDVHTSQSGLCISCSSPPVSAREPPMMDDIILPSASNASSTAATGDCPHGPGLTSVSGFGKFNVEADNISPIFISLSSLSLSLGTRKGP